MEGSRAVAEITFRLSKCEADALQQEWGYGVMKSAARRSAECKLRQAIWHAYPELFEVQRKRLARESGHAAKSRERKPVLLDLFSGAGGATKGYQEAGFYVIGVDINPQPNYCGDEFFQEDALEALRRLPTQDHAIDAIHASPPCQAYAELATNRKRTDHPELLEPTRQLLQKSGLPWVVENVPTAPMPDSFVLCGTTFGLPIVRHRRFEVSPPMGLQPSACRQTKFARSVDHPGTYPYASGSWEAGWREHVLPVVWPWMTLAEAGQAIPPAYTRHIGLFLRNHLVVPR
jgi:hypothetical protein